MNKDELNALRAEVRRRHKAATSKVSRLRSRGVELGGTNIDVRRDLSKVKRYNATQLRAYAATLDRFVSRQTAYVPGDKGVPLPAAKWREYKRLERMNNRRTNTEYEKVADTFLPTPSIRIRDRRTMLSQSALGQSANVPFQEMNRKSTGITNEKALDKIIEQMRDKTRRGYLPEQLAKSREQFMKMLGEIGEQRYLKAASELSDAQFDILWNYTSFATQISSDYEIMKLKARGEMERSHEKIHEDNQDAISDLLTWAQGQPANRTTTQTRKRSRGK